MATLVASFLFPPRWTCRIETASPRDLHKRMALHTYLSTPVVLNRTGDGAKFHCYSNIHTASHQLKFFVSTRSSLTLSVVNWQWDILSHKIAVPAYNLVFKYRECELHPIWIPAGTRAGKNESAWLANVACLAFTRFYTSALHSPEDQACLQRQLHGFLFVSWPIHPSPQMRLFELTPNAMPPTKCPQEARSHLMERHLSLLH